MVARRIVLWSCALVLSLGGCASVPPAVKDFPYPTVVLNDVAYFPVIKMCEAQGIAWDYDPLSQTLILKKGGSETKLLIGSDQAMTDGDIRALSAPMEIRESVIYAPVDLRTFFEPALCKLPLEKPDMNALFWRAVETVVLDAGHGGKDPGATGRAGLREKGIVLDVVGRIKSELEGCGLSVQTTRGDDTFIELSERCDLANREKADIFVSVHANASRSRRIEGFEVYYLSENLDDNERAREAAESQSLVVDGADMSRRPLGLKATLWDMIYTENRRESFVLARTISESVRDALHLQILGIKGARFAVLKGTQMPAVLVEIGYISNREGERKLRDPLYRQKLAAAIAQGIINFKRYAEGGQ